MRFPVFLCSIILLALAGIYFHWDRSDQPQNAAVAPVMPQNNAAAQTLPQFPKVMVKSELLERQRVPNYVVVLLIQSDFPQLEALAEHYRTTKERTPSGLWYLSLFHAGVNRYLQTVRSKPQNLPSGKRWEGSADEMHAKIINEWQAAFPNSPNPYLAHAKRLREQAWRIRGPSYADKVPQEAWRPFHEKLEAARDYLIKHREIAGRDPEWYRLRIDTATELGEPTELVMDTVTQAIDTEPYYYQTYFAAVRHFLPKWGGKSEYINALTNMAVENTTEEDGMSLYARIYWYVSQQSKVGPLIFHDPDVSWVKMTAGMDEVLSSYPDNWNINNFLYFSCVAGDRNQAKKLLEMMRGEPIMSVWQETVLFNACKDFARGVDQETKPGSPS